MAVVAGVAVSALAISTGSAEAARPGTQAEVSAIAPQINVTPECADVTVSTLDGTWAVAGSTNASGCLQGNGFVIFRLEQGAWNLTYQSSGDQCPIKAVPIDISVDLGLCKPISKLAYFYNAWKERLVIKPKRLGQGAHGFYANVRWSKWSATEARASAKLDYADYYTRFRIPVKIRLYRVKTCENGIKLFTRRKVRALHRRDAKRIRFDTIYTHYGSCKANQWAPYD